MQVRLISREGAFDEIAQASFVICADYAVGHELARDVAESQFRSRSMEPGDMPQETARARSELGVVSIVFPELIHLGPHGVRNRDGENVP
jgi:hypothetical protein